MKRVTNKERLLNIKRQLELCVDFIKDPKVEIIKDYGSMGKIAINKNIGSDICGLYYAIEKIESLINKDKVEVIKNATIKS